MSDYAIEVDGQMLTEEQYASARSERIQSLYSTFAGMRNEWVAYRANSGVETRWRRASRMYFGAAYEEMESSLRLILQDGPATQSKTAVRSKVEVNIVRPKVDQAVARICEIILPVDDRNWAIGPTPVPEVAGRVGNHELTVDASTGTSSGLSADAEANGLMQACKEAAEAMQRAIDDDLQACHYNGEQRKTIEDGVRLGTGVLKGPFPANKQTKKWTHVDGKHVLDQKTKARPASKRVDPWDVFFDPSCGNEHQRGRGVWERRSATRREIRALAGIRGYDVDAIREVLSEPARRVRVAEKRVAYEATEDKSYELWEYHGDVEPDELADLSEKTGDPIDGVTCAVLVMVNDRVIGTLQSWIPDGTLPYDTWTWRASDNSPYGHGLPEEMRDQQGVVTAAWRQVMDNARFSVGGQIVMKRGRLIPQNGKYEWEPNKVWFAKDDEKDVRDAFSVFEIQSHVDKLLMVAQAAMNFADTETNMPQLMGGQGQGQGTGSVPETVGGMVLLYNNANAVLRQRVKLFDDGVTRPHISRYYDFNMAYNPDEKIKGDFEVIARGSSALIERDIQNQAMVNLTAITSNPRFAPHIKVRDELKATLKAFRMNPDDIMKTEEQVKKDMENTEQPQDPRIASAQMGLEAKQAELEDRKEQRAADAEQAQREDAFHREQLAYNRQREQAEFTIAQTDSEINRSGIILREQTKTALTREQIAAKDRLARLNIESKHQIFNAESALRVRTGQGI